MKLLSLFAIALGNQSDDRKFTNDKDFMSQETPAWWLNKPAVERLSVLVSPLTVGRVVKVVNLRYHVISSFIKLI